MGYRGEGVRFVEGIGRVTLAESRSNRQGKLAVPMRRRIHACLPACPYSIKRQCPKHIYGITSVGSTYEEEDTCMPPCLPLQYQKRPITVSKETNYSVKRDLLQCQKRASLPPASLPACLPACLPALKVSKETYYSVKREPPCLPASPSLPLSLPRMFTGR